MTPKEIRQAVLAARTVKVECGERIYTLRMPTRFDVLSAAERAGFGSEVEAGSSMTFMRVLSERAIVGWVGVTVGDLLPDAEETSVPVDFDAQLVADLLDALPQDLNAVSSAVADWLYARREKDAALAKN